MNLRLCMPIYRRLSLIVYRPIVSINRSIKKYNRIITPRTIPVYTAIVYGRRMDAGQRVAQQSQRAHQYAV